MPPSRVFDTDGIVAIDACGDGVNGDAAGLMAIPISRTPRDYVMLFRRERIATITWGGNPDKTATGVDGGRISPRKSFAAFKQTICDRSAPFTDRDRRVDETIRTALIEVILRLSESTDVEALGGRVQALARAHDLVTSKSWAPAPLVELFEAEIEAFIPNQQDRLQIVGPAMLLRPEAFSSMALVVHELVTNSVKYGALSDGGSVEVTIDHRAGEGLYVNWREIGGPPVRPPTRVGFDTVIVERTVPFDLQGTAAVRYPVEGFEADFFIPARHLAGRAERPAMPSASSCAAKAPERTDLITQPLCGLHVLLLENNMIVALTVENLLKDLGAQHVWTASHVEHASEIFDREVVEFAILDINLGTSTSFGLAMRLREAAVPFFFASGYGNGAGLHEDLDGAIIVRKPYGKHDLHRAIVTVRNI